MPDERLLTKRVLAGHKAAFDELVRLYQNRIFAFIMRMTADREAALDITQETFLAVFNNLAGFRRESALSTWLYQIAANKTRNYLKKAGREIALQPEYQQSLAADNPEIALQKKQELELLRALSEELPEKQRAIFCLRFYDHLKFSEIAEIQKSSVSSVKTGFAEAIKKLKKRSEEK